MVAGSSPSAYAQARELIDDVHRRDPRYVKRREAHAAAGAAGAAAAGLDVVGGAATAAGTGVEGDADSAGGQLDDEGQDELAYADAMEAWVNALVNKVGPSAEDRLASLPGGRDLVRIAARCQHLERFATPRSSFPDGKAGYLQWRRSLYHTQADHAARLMAQAGMADDECRLVRTWVSKTDLKPGKSGGEWGTQLLEDAAVLVFLQDQLHYFAAQHTGYTREKFVDIIKKTWRKLSDEGKDAAKGLDMPSPLGDIIADAVGESAS